MPTYEYVSNACGHSFDELQSFSDAPLTKCPACKKKKLRRLFGTGAAVLFKGAGFYETDYRSESYKSAAKKEADTTTPPATPSAGDKSTKSEVTPAKPATSDKSKK